MKQTKRVCNDFIVCDRNFKIITVAEIFHHLWQAMLETLRYCSSAHVVLLLSFETFIFDDDVSAKQDVSDKLNASYNDNVILMIFIKSNEIWMKIMFHSSMYCHIRTLCCLLAANLIKSCYSFVIDCFISYTSTIRYIYYINMLRLIPFI